MGGRKHPPERNAEMKKAYIEISRRNVTVAEFFRYIHSQCKKKSFECGVDRDSFEKPVYEIDVYYYVRDGIKYFPGCGGRTAQEDGTDAACESEICKVKPYDVQTYIRNFDGTVFNEICEFSFYDETRGYGYYFQINTI